MVTYSKKNCHTWRYQHYAWLHHNGDQMSRTIHIYIVQDQLYHQCCYTLHQKTSYLHDVARMQLFDDVHHMYAILTPIKSAFQQLTKYSQ